MGMKCTVCKTRNYVLNINDSNIDAKSFEVKKFCKKCGKHTAHKLVQKLK